MTDERTVTSQKSFSMASNGHLGSGLLSALLHPQNDQTHLPYSEQNLTGIIQVNGQFAAAQLQAAVDQVAEVIARTSGQIFLVSPHGPTELLVAICALWREGRCAVPWRTDMCDEYYLRDLVRADHILSVCVGADGFKLKLQKTAWADNLARHDTAFRAEKVEAADLVLCSSGTTGSPKAILVRKQSFLANCKVMADALKLGDRSLGLWVCSTDMGFTSSIAHMFMAIDAGVQFCHLGGCTAEQISEIVGGKTVGYGGSPLGANRFVEQAPSSTRLSLIMTSGDFLRPAMVERMVQRRPEIEIVSVFGLSEFCGRVGYAPHAEATYPAALRYGSFAMQPLPGMTLEVRNSEGSDAEIEEPGELWVRSEWLADGYVHHNGSFEELGHDDGGSWFRTGDRAMRLADGRFVLVGRDADIFKVGGEQVSRNAIEAALAAPLAGFDYAVTTSPHELLGQVPVLLVSVKSSSEQLPARANLIRAVRAQLSTKHVPFEFLQTASAVPRTKSGKVKLSETATLAKTAMPW